MQMATNTSVIQKQCLRINTSRFNIVRNKQHQLTKESSTIQKNCKRYKRTRRIQAFKALRRQHINCTQEFPLSRSSCGSSHDSGCFRSFDTRHFCTWSRHSSFSFLGPPSPAHRVGIRTAEASHPLAPYCPDSVDSLWIKQTNCIAYHIRSTIE